ncbi:YdiU family protein [Paenibacillaceae bacterium WGS1546]|uniref:protein adenylyltransferase SelO n=1 Tax=Cohnella sp. WGS1546 TaxID=3366810 RepID=UPI00372D28CF
MTDNERTKAAGWRFDNSYARLPETLYTRLDPTPVRKPQLAVLNRPLAEKLGLDAAALAEEEGVGTLAGNRIPAGALPLAQAYAGHQFGHFNVLGDGRAHLLGEQITPDGERFDIQLKGSGPTPYSRRGDGRAALGPMLREYIVSEAMHALGIPTTRSLAVVATGEPIYRETELPGAVLTRVAASHLRVGTFQYAAYLGSGTELRTLADYALRRHYPDIREDGDRYLNLLKEMSKRQAALIAKWQLVGFVHGVMNTDNMAVSGETIDYGPCAFMDAYDPATVFSSIDTHGRYAYGNQPGIGAWNVARFAETLLPLLHDDREEAVRLAEEAIAEYGAAYRSNWLAGMRAKLGMTGEEPEDEALAEDLLGLMAKYRADYTNTFRALIDGKPDDPTFAESEEFAAWAERWRVRLGRGPDSDEERRMRMQAANPAVIPRNHRVEEALDAASAHGDYGKLERLLGVLSRPFEYTPAPDDDYAAPSCSTRPYRTFCGT